MKRIVFILFTLLISIFAFAQQQLEQKTFVPANDLKINLSSTILNSYSEISCERVFREDLSFGFTVGFSLDGEPDKRLVGLESYFRWFFGGNQESTKKAGAGLFIETTGAVFEIKRTDSNPNYGAELGVSVGWKYISKNNWVGEFLFGAGRDFVNDVISPRVGISIGKRL